MQNIQTFRAGNLQAALSDIRSALGPDASVLHTRQVRAGLLGWIGRSQVEVTAGVTPPPSAAPPRIMSPIMSPVDEPPITPPQAFWNGGEGPARQPLHRFEASLIAAGVEPSVASRWIGSAIQLASGSGTSNQRTASNPEMGMEHLQRAIAGELNLSGPIQTAAGKRRVVALVGPTGVGKTTTIAKLAAGFRLESRRKVGLLTIDTYRIAAVDQLRAYAEIMDLPMQVVQTPEQMQPAMDKLGDVDLVLIDTAGRSPRSDVRIDQLAAFLGRAQPDETHLVLSTTSSPASITAAIDGFAPVGATSVILTKLDETPHTAGLLSALSCPDRAASMAISYVTDGQAVPNDISVADARRLLTTLLPAGAMPSVRLAEAA